MTELTAIIDETAEATVKDLEAALGQEGSANELKLAPLAVLAFIGVKVALPIVCSFVSRELWERYNRIRTRAQADAAKAELTGADATGAVESADTVIAAVSESLREEGVPAGEADRIARDAYDRVRARISPTG